jgi:hypothetical protein
MSELRQRLANLTPEQRALLEQRLLGKGGAGAAEQGIPRRQGTGPCALSFCQQRLWFLDQLSPNTPTYNVPIALRLRGPVNLPALDRALEALVARHEVLRTTFDCPSGTPVQVVAPAWPKVLRVVDLRGKPGAGGGALGALLKVEAARPFDLSRDVMLRATLLRLADDDAILLLLSHHVAWDLRSKTLMFEELAAVYNAAVRGAEADLPPLPIQYADFALWQRQHLQGPTLERLVSYWKQQLAGAPPTLEVPGDHPRPPVQSLKGGKYFFPFPPALLEQAKAVGRQHRVTLYMTLLGAFKVFLFASSGQEDLCVGSPIAGRNHVETEKIIGFFINTLVLRTRLGGEPAFAEVLARVREVTLGAHAHQELPFEKLVEVLRPPRDLSRNPLFQVNFRVANAPAVPPDLRGLDVTQMDLIDNATSKFDLALEVGAAEGVKSYWEYSTDLYTEASVVRLRGEFERLLGELLAEPGRPVPELPAFRELQAARGARAARQTARGLRGVRRRAGPPA